MFLDSVRRPGATRTEGPHGGASYVRGANRNRIGHSHAHELFPRPLFQVYTQALGDGRRAAKVRVLSRSAPPPWGVNPISSGSPHVRVASQAKSRKIPTRQTLPLFSAGRLKANAKIEPNSAANTPYPPPPPRMGARSHKMAKTKKIKAETRPGMVSPLGTAPTTTHARSLLENGLAHASWGRASWAVQPSQGQTPWGQPSPASLPPPVRDAILGNPGIWALTGAQARPVQKAVVFFVSGGYFSRFR